MQAAIVGYEVNFIDRIGKLTSNATDVHHVVQFSKLAYHCVANMHVRRMDLSAEHEIQAGHFSQGLLSPQLTI